jgi:hypothetical protein
MTRPARRRMSPLPLAGLILAVMVNPVRAAVDWVQLDERTDPTVMVEWDGFFFAAQVQCGFRYKNPRLFDLADIAFNRFGRNERLFAAIEKTGIDQFDDGVRQFGLSTFCNNVASSFPGQVAW